MLLPAPSKPTSPVMPPAGMVAEMALRATRSPKRLVSPSRRWRSSWGQPDGDRHPGAGAGLGSCTTMRSRWTRWVQIRRFPPISG